MTDLTISAIRARAVMTPLRRPITTAFASIPAAPLVLVDVDTKEGITGRSYLFAYTPLMLKPLVALLEDLADGLIGQSIAPRVLIAALEDRFRLLGRQGLPTMAMAGLDMAFWDAMGQAADMTVARMLGGSDKPLPCYDSLGVFKQGRDEALIEGSIAQGFGAIKVKIGAGTAAEDVSDLLAIREIIGPDVTLMADYNQALTPTDAIARINAIEDALDLGWIEEPVAAEDYAGHRRVKSAIRTPLQTGENWWQPDDAARALDAEICDLAMPDMMKIGGFSGWQQAGAMCAAHSIPVSSHIFVEASAHALAATPNAHLLEYLDVASGILVDPYVVVDGCLAPKGPGLGITWDEPAIAKLLE